MKIIEEKANVAMYIIPKDCGHKLGFGHVLASKTDLIERLLNRDPRVVEYYDIEDGDVIELGII